MEHETPKERTDNMKDKTKLYLLQLEVSLYANTVHGPESAAKAAVDAFNAAIISGMYGGGFSDDWGPVVNGLRKIKAVRDNRLAELCDSQLAIFAAHKASTLKL